MIHRIGTHLTLAAIGLTAVAGLVNALRGQAQSQDQAAAAPVFEVASVKPSRSFGSGAFQIGSAAGHGDLTLTGKTLKDCIQWAYGVKDYQISGPDWLGSERYDIVAKAGSAVPDDQLRLMLRSLLADRFKLTLHSTTQVRPVYALAVGKTGPKFHEVKPDGPARIFPGRAGIVTQQVSMARFAELLATRLDNPVRDMTGLTSVFDLKLEWSPDPSVTPDSTPGPSIFTALQEQLGLKLEAQKAPVEILVIDHAEKVPTQN